MKNTFLVIWFLLISGVSYSQEQPPKVVDQQPLKINKTQLNAGVGLSGWGVPFYVGIDYSVHKDITIGGEFSYRSYSDYFEYRNFRHTIMGFEANGNYHFNSLLKIPYKWDLYAGLNLGFFTWTSSPGDYNNHSSGLGLGAQIGGRYYLNNKLGLNLEFGGGNEFLNGKFGLTFKLK